MPDKPLRVIWPLLKARVVDRSDTHVKISFGYDHGAPTTITIAVDTRRYDIRDGDLLTLYTEVLLKNAQAQN